jgi:hypothetical protein
MKSKGQGLGFMLQDGCSERWREVQHLQEYMQAQQTRVLNRCSG